jgi:dihydrofolate reductase
MRVVANFFVSLDGVMEAPHNWHFPYLNDEVGQAVGAGFATTDALLMGRVTYEEWYAVWPHRSGDQMADTINSARKYVVSETLDSVEWNNSVLISGDVKAQIAELKAQPGRDLVLSGSAKLVEWLLHEDLLDELRLLVHPLVLGHGRRLFAGDGRTKKLELASAETFSNGVVYLTYRAGAPTDTAAA